MKRLCRDMSIHDADLVCRAVRKCMSKPSTRRRHDTVKYFAQVLGVSRDDASARLERDDEERELAYRIVAERLAGEIAKGDFACPAPKVKDRKDPSSGKVRNISVLHIRQLLLDHVAVEALRPLFRRVGEFQCAGIPGRGTCHGLHALKRWVRERGMRYFVQMDIVKFYPSVDKARLMAWLRGRVKNPELLWLVHNLLYTCDNGVHIGSYLSQTLCTMYTSDIYHLVKERLHAEITRRGIVSKRQMASHILTYMDDVILMGRNKRLLEKAAAAVERHVSSEMGLVMKPWRVKDLNEGMGIDALGYRVHRKHVTMRRQIAKRARRTAMRVAAARKAGRLPLSLAKRLVAYNGWVKRTDSRRFSRNTGWQSAFAASTWKVSFSTKETK